MDTDNTTNEEKTAAQVQEEETQREMALNPVMTPDDAKQLNVQDIEFQNLLDDNGNPTGGHVRGLGIQISWQNGPRGKDAEGNLGPSNGAFVEDAIYAAKQRLEYFQDSKYATDENAEAIEHLQKALEALNKRRQNRAERGVEGQHEV